MRFLSKLSLFVIFFTFPYFLPPDSRSLLCPLFSWSAQGRDLGRDGRNGSDGEAGRRGRDGRSQTVFANGSSLNLDLSGEDGTAGRDGRDGEKADCDRQPRDVDHNLRAADGGRGGNGGNGGDGGNGGSLTVYYTNLADLRSIFVGANGGRGARSGRRGYGGRGCSCRVRDWEIRSCTGTPGSPDYSCQTRQFSCEDGDDGRDGVEGKDGNDGALGSLTLIKGTQELAPEQPMVQVAMPQVSDRVLALSKNKWQIRNGAAALLAPGSVIADQYREFVTRIESSFQLIWNAQRPLSDFSGEMVTIRLEDDQQVRVSFPEDVWVDGTISQQGGKTQLIAANVILKEEATQLKRADFSGSGAELIFALIDQARKSELISTQFRIKYNTSRISDRFESNFDYITRYEGTIPAELVSRDKNRFVLNLGKLPIDSQYLRPGVAVEIELVAIRSFAGHSTEQEIQWRGEIRP